MNTTILDLLRKGWTIHFNSTLDGGVVVNLLHDKKKPGFAMGSDDPFTVLCCAIENTARHEHKEFIYE